MRKKDWTGPFRRQFTDEENAALDVADEVQMKMNVLHWMRSKGEADIRRVYPEWSEYIDYLSGHDLNNTEVFNQLREEELKKARAIAEQLPKGVRFL